MSEKIISSNKKAFHDFQILEKLEAGIKLTGAEVKSVKNGSVSLKESFVRIENGELFIKNLHISPYKFARSDNHDPVRNRKLLVNKKELNQLFGATQKEGLTIVPLNIYLKNGFIKLEIATAKGKKKWDKREDIRKKETVREMRKISNS